MTPYDILESLAQRWNQGTMTGPDGVTALTEVDRYISRFETQLSGLEAPSGGAELKELGQRGLRAYREGVEQLRSTFAGGQSQPGDTEAALSMARQGRDLINNLLERTRA